MDDKAAVGAVVDEMYAMISGPAGPRDWARQAACFHSDARQMRTGVDGAGTPWIKIMSPVDYQADVTPFFMSTPFFEVEMARRIDVLGNMAHVWSSTKPATRPMTPPPNDVGSTPSSSSRAPTGPGRSSR